MGHGHHHHELPNPSDSRYKEIRKVTLVGSAVDLVLAVLKITFGWLGQSQALIADGIHSLSDLATDAMVIYAAKHSSKDADACHPYGHGRYETIATVLLGGALILVGFGIAWDAALRLFDPESLFNPGWIALAVAALSVILKEAIYQYTMRAAKKLRSHMLQANAWHSRTDAISSIFEIVGVGGAMMGLNYLDAIAAIVVAIMVAKVGWDLAWHSIQELTDAALDQERVKAIEDSILNIGCVRSLHMLRTRRMGADALVDVHIIVEPTISVSEGHQISEIVRGTLIKQFDEITDVMVHIDAEDDEHSRPNIGLPLRDEVLILLSNACKDIPEYQQNQKITLHYLNGGIHIELLLPLNILENIQDGITVKEQFTQVASQEPRIASITVRYD